MTARGGIGSPTAAVEMLVRATAARPELAEAALANEAVRDLIARHPGIYTEAGIRNSPIVRAEFDHASVIGHPGRVGGDRLGQELGRLPRGSVRSGPRRLRSIPSTSSMSSRADNPYNRRVLQRKSLKRRLPKAFRRWVNEAYRSPRRDFLARLPEDAAAAIRRSLSLDPIAFWRAASGTLDLDLPAPAVQPSLFDDPGGSIAPRWRK